ncbi:hypothetical protein GCM10028832_03200 [Streptomyces sparsus]
MYPDLGRRQPDGLSALKTSDTSGFGATGSQESANLSASGTAELLDERWRGWDLTDPLRPAFLEPGATPMSHHPAPSFEVACA